MKICIVSNTESFLMIPGGKKGKERKKSEDKKTALGYSLVLFTHALFNRRIKTV